MEKLTNTIEAVLFASGKPIAVSDLAEKLGVTEAEVRRSLLELKERYGADGGIQLLEFNEKAQLGSNPAYKEGVAAVLNPIREKELTRAILECAAIIAYKQPITRTEIELLRGVNSDYAVNELLALNFIYPCGRKDAVGHPVLFATTDEFLKRFKLNSLADLPDYDALMAMLTRPDVRDTYLYTHDEYKEEPPAAEPPKQTDAKLREKLGSDIDFPDFLHGVDADEIVKIS